MDRTRWRSRIITEEGRTDDPRHGPPAPTPLRDGGRVLAQPAARVGPLPCRAPPSREGDPENPPTAGSRGGGRGLIRVPRFLASCAPMRPLAAGCGVVADAATL